MTDLSDFGEGIDRNALSSRDKQKQKLCTWIQQYENKVYTRNKKPYSNGVFSIESSYRPELLVKSRQNNYLIKFVSSQDSSNILDGLFDTFKYWKEMAVEETKIKVRNRTISIDAVLIVSDRSIQGHLFHKQGNNDPRLSQRSEGAKIAADQNQIPEFEHTGTEKVLRLLWRFAEEKVPETTVGIGAMLSSANDTEDPASEPEEYAPAALYKTPGQQYAQHWEYIPFYLSD